MEHELFLLLNSLKKLTNNKMDNLKSVYIRLILVMVFWGSAFVSGRILTQKFHPMNVGFFRFFIASSVLIPFLMYKKPDFYKINFIQFLKVLSLAATGVFSYNFFFFSGLKLVEAGRSSVIIATNPAITAIVAVFFMGEVLNFRKFLGFSFALFGIIIVVTKGELATLFHGGFDQGELFLLGAVISWVTYTILGKMILKKLTSLEATTWACFLGTLMLLPFALHFNFFTSVQTLDGSDLLHFANIGLFSTCLGFIWYYDGVAKIGAATASSFINLVPIIGILCGSLFLNESITYSLIIGSLVVIVGVYLVNKKPFIPL